MKRYALTAALAAGLLLSLPGCDSDDNGDMDTTTSAPSMGAINETCPMMGEAVDPGSTTDYKGQKIGFCCDGCVGPWNKLSDAEKDAKLAAMKK